MTVDLNGVHLKLSRARKHIEDLDAEIRRGGRPYRVSAQGQGNGYLTIVGFKGPPTRLPDDLALSVGDCLSNLRSALDHLAWQIVGARGIVPSGKTKFPIYDHGRAAVCGDFGCVAGPVAEVIHLVQPYQRNDHEADLLWILNYLRNKDSHQTLHVVRDQLVTFTRTSRDKRTGGMVSQQTTTSVRRLIPGDTLSVQVPFDRPEQEHNLVVTVDVALEESGPAGSVALVTLLSDIGEHIRKSVVDPIAALL